MPQTSPGASTSPWTQIWTCPNPDNRAREDLRKNALSRWVWPQPTLVIPHLCRWCLPWSLHLGAEDKNEIVLFLFLDCVSFNIWVWPPPRRVNHSSRKMRDFPGGLVVKTPHSRGRELDSILGQGSRFPHAAAKDPEFCNYNPVRPNK